MVGTTSISDCHFLCLLLGGRLFPIYLFLCECFSIVFIRNYVYAL